VIFSIVGLFYFAPELSGFAIIFAFLAHSRAAACY